MANLKSTTLTNLATSPMTHNPAGVAMGTLKVAKGTVEVSTNEDTGNIFRMVRVPSNCYIARVGLFCDVIAVGGAVDIGVYYADNLQRPGITAGAVIDVDHFASAQVVTSALTDQNITHEADPLTASGGYGKGDIEKPLWQTLGLSADPACQFDICCTVTTDMGGAGTISLMVLYSSGV